MACIQLQLPPEHHLSFPRAQHVFKEAGLVFAFKDAKTLEELGSLMSQSHASCRDLYECSCPELDRLTQLCR